MVLRTYKGHFTDVSLNNNTPVNTEVLWGPGGIERLLWWGLLRASGEVSQKAAQNPAQHVPARPCAGLHGKKDDVGKNSEIVAGASTCNDMRVGANAPNNGAGGIRTPVP